VLRGLSRRLDRLWQEHQYRRSVGDRHRDSHDLHERFIATVRAGLCRAGIDPATVRAMRLYEPGSVFAPRPEPPPPPPDSPVERVRQKLLRVIECHREHPIDLDKASPMELFALYCFVPDAPGVAYLAGECPM